MAAGQRPRREVREAGGERARARRRTPLKPTVFVRKAPWIEHLVVLSGYLVSTLLMTYPVALFLTNAIPMDHQIKDWYPGDGDPWQALWAFWYFKRAFVTFPPQLFWTDLVFYPIGFEMPFITGIGAILVPAALLASLVSLTLTYNLLWILSFVLAGYGMYLLARSLFRDRLVAFFCGYVFMFSSYRVMHAREHPQLLMASFLVPLFALCLSKATEQPTTKRWVLCALVWAASAGISWYCTISLFIYLAVFAVLRTRGRWPKNLAARHLRSVTVALLVLVVAAAPFVLPLMISPARDSIVNRSLTESTMYAADLLAFFVPSPTNPVFGKLTGPMYRHFTGNPYEQTVYLGYILLGLAVFGVLRSSKEKTRLFVVAAVTFFILALGPFLHVSGQYRFPVDGEELSVPLPYLLLHYIPFVNGVRVPSRFTELLVFALAVLAGYGLSAICAHVKTPRWRAALVGVLLVGVAIESASTPFPVVSTKAPSIYSEIGAVREPFMVLELPLDWRIIKYHYYQTIHGKRLLVGHPVRSREKYSSYPEGLPLIPFLKDPKLLLERPTPGDAGRDAERLATFFDIRYIVIHRRYLEPPVFEKLDRFVADHFPQISRREDDEVVVYALRRPEARSALWPEDYVIDFGAPHRDFALLTGWSGDEQWGETTIRWSDDRESSIYLYLNEPADRVLELRLQPLIYEGSPRQTVAVYVNGALHERLTLERGWTQYELKLPANVFRAGLNTVTFKYGYAVSLARVSPGSSDTRTLAVAFDYVALRQAR
jgi:hypothetical protein